MGNETSRRQAAKPLRAATMQVLAVLLMRSGYDPRALWAPITEQHPTPESLAGIRLRLRLRGCPAWRAEHPVGEAFAVERLVADVLRALERDDSVAVVTLLRQLADGDGAPSLAAALARDAVNPVTILAVLDAVEDEPCR